MDPNQTLELLRQRCGDFDRAKTTDAKLPVASEIVDAFNGLDAWLTRGGFLPDAWRDR